VADSKPNRPKDITARSRRWKVRFVHSRRISLGLFTIATKPKLVITRRVMTFNPPRYVIRATDVQSVKFIDPGWSVRDKAGLLYLDVALRVKKLAEIGDDEDADPRIQHFGMRRAAAFKRILDAGVKHAGWKVNT
jgi:hypothetical protein